MSSSQRKIFISYAKEDHDFAKHLSDALTNFGFSITDYFDNSQVMAGEHIYNRISNGIDQSSVVIFVISRHSEMSKWMQAELSLSLALKNKKLLLPIIIDSPEYVPHMLRQYLWLDFRDERRFNQNVVSIATAIMRGLSRSSDSEDAKSLGRIIEAEKSFIISEKHIEALERERKNVKIKASFILLVYISGTVGLLSVFLFRDNFHNGTYPPRIEDVISLIWPIITAFIGFYFGSKQENYFSPSKDNSTELNDSKNPLDSSKSHAVERDHGASK